MELVLDVKQTLKASPQMIQSMNILQMGTLELQEYVEQALLENPTLELESDRKENDQHELRHKLEWLMSNDRQNRWYHQEEAQDLIDLAAAPFEESLYDHLRSQINMEKLSIRLCIAIDCILTSLNSNGYLDETTEELSARCGQSIETVLLAETLVRNLEPAGICARTLSECLSIQLERKGESGLPLTLALHHLEDIAHNHYNHISKATGASREEIQVACKQIRSLNPRPGAIFAPREAPSYVIPDLMITEQNGELMVTPGDHFLPVLKISSYYQKLMTKTDERDVQEYLTDKIYQASCLIKSIEQRRDTLLSCALIIVSKQEQFFRHGAGYLQPLTLSDIAAGANIHESTVSRAIKDKYIQCIHGIYPMNHFLTRAIPSNSGECVSAERVKAAMRSLINEEDKHKPLSDQKICNLLAAQGFKLSRRTVSKYREEIGISSAAGRKEY